MSKKLTLLSEAIKEGFDPRDMFSYFTAEQFISFSNWATGSHSFDWVKYYAWLNANYNLWHDPMPPMFAVDDMAEFTTILGEPSKLVPARINAVHIYRNETKYDIELHLVNDHKERLYNVPSVFLQRKSGDMIDVFGKIFDGQSEIVTNTELPPPFTPVIIKRKSGELYFGFRTGAPVSEDPDFSRNCHWHGNPLNEEMDIEKFSLRFTESFSDVTVAGWVHLYEYVKKNNNL